MLHDAYGHPLTTSSPENLRSFGIRRLHLDRHQQRRTRSQAEVSGVFAIKGTPEPAVKVLRDAIREAVKKPQFVNAMEKVETPIQYLDQPEFKKFLEVDEKRSVQVVRGIGKVQ